MISLGGDFQVVEIDGFLNDAERRKDVTFTTKSNNDVQENRNYTVVLKHTSKDRDSDLVKLKTDSQTMIVIIEDNDICMSHCVLTKAGMFTDILSLDVRLEPYVLN